MVGTQTRSDAATRSRGRTRGRRRRASSNVEKIGRWIVVAISAAAGGMAGAHPTGSPVGDAVMTAGWAAVVTLAASRGRRWTLLVAAGTGAVLATDGVATVCGVAAVAIGFAAAVLDRRSPVVGAVVGALAIGSLLRLPAIGFHGAPSLITAAVTAPILYSGYRYATRTERRRARRIAVGLGIFTVLACAVLALVLLQARSRVERAIQNAQEGFQAIGESEQGEAIVSLEDAAHEFGKVESVLNVWWLAPARLLPLVGHQSDALATMAAEGERLAISAAVAADSVDYDALRLQGGAIDLAILSNAVEPLTGARDALERAADHLGDLSPAWLLPALRDRFDLLRTEVDRAVPAARLAVEALNVGPELLGAEGPRRYLLLFGTPAETRELGGFVGNFAEITADQGKLSLTRSGRSLDLSDPRGELGFVMPEGADPAVWFTWQVTRFFGNIGASPDFTEVAPIAAQLYQQAVGVPVDGVIYLDPYALAAMLDITGPVQLSDADVRISAGNAAELLLVEQYLVEEAPPGEEGEGRGNRRRPEPEGDGSGQRVDLLDEATRLTFEALTTGDLPAPAVVATALDPVAEQGRLLAWSADPEVGTLFEDLGVDGRFPASDGGDVLSITQANQGPNKLDAYLHRRIDYEASVRPDTGEITTTLTIELENTAPATGLPDEVMGNRSGLPPGTNDMTLTVYSGLHVRRAEVNGAQVGVATLERFGINSFTVSVIIPPQSTATVVFSLEGVLERPSPYRLTVASQPVANPDEIRIVVKGADGFRVTRAPGLALTGGVADGVIEDRRLNIVEAQLKAK